MDSKEEGMVLSPYWQRQVLQGRMGQVITLAVPYQEQGRAVQICVADST